jgi:hypothetical protein
VLREVKVPLPRPRLDLTSPQASAIEADILNTLLNPRIDQRT